MIKVLRRPLGVRWKNAKHGYSDIFLPLESSPGSNKGSGDGWTPVVDDDDEIELGDSSDDDVQVIDDSDD